MKVSPRPRVSVLLRIFAGTCALLWLVGITVCGMERIYNCAGHEEACAGHASPIHDHDAVSPLEKGGSHDAEHHDDAEAHEQAAASRHHHDVAAQHQHGRKGKKCDDEKRCCANIQALIVTSAPMVIVRPVSQPAFNISHLCAALDHALTTPSTEALRQSKTHDCVLTPEVCLGPAHRSLAPPSLA